MDYNVHDCPCLFADKPKVSMRLGTNLDPDNLRTGNDVYFECEVKANPVAHRLIWLHNVSLLLYNFLPRVEQGLGQFYTRYSMYTCTLYNDNVQCWQDVLIRRMTRLCQLGGLPFLRDNATRLFCVFLLYESNSPRPMSNK